LNLAIVGAMFTVKELMLSPVGILFEPPDFVVEFPDDPQAAAIRATIAARLTQPTRWKRLPPLLLPSRIPDPFLRNGHEWHRTHDDHLVDADVWRSQESTLLASLTVDLAVETRR
jgi:hypothetical protein